MKKRTVFYLLSVAVAFAACQGSQEPQDCTKQTDTIVAQDETLVLEQRSGERCYTMDYEEEMFGRPREQRSYYISWPSDDHPVLQRAILENVFGKGAKDFDAAAEQFLANSAIDGFEDHKAYVVKETKNFEPNDYCNIRVICENDKRFYSFLVTIEEYGFGAAHPNAAVNYINYDIREKRLIQLSDLMDTTHLSSIARKALKSLPENKETLECVYSKDDIYASSIFTIDLDKNEIILVYEPYDIGPYACGILQIHLPVAWLSQELQLTPYCNELFHLTAEA